jgi:cell division protein FtsB
MAELEKLRKKLEDQEDRFRVLAEENSELKANLSKINQQDS